MESIDNAVRHFGAQANLLVWEGIPWGGATTLSPPSQSLEDFLSIARAVRAPLLYLDPNGCAAAFATNGVVHVFATPDERARLTGESSADDESPHLEEDEDEDDDGGYGSPYYDWQTGKEVAGRVRDVVDALISDERFNGHRSGHVVAEYVADLDADDAEAVARAEDVKQSETRLVTRSV